MAGWTEGTEGTEGTSVPFVRSARVFFPAELHIDNLAGRRHRVVLPALGHRRPVEFDRLGRAQSCEAFEGEQDHAEVIELAKDGKKIGHEVERRDDVQKGEEWQYLGEIRHGRLAQE